MSGSSSKRAMTRREVRGNAVLTAVLACAVFWFLNALSRDHLDVRRDLSADGLYDIAPTTRALLGDLEDVLQVQAYFTGEARHGPVQIAKRRLVHQLGELESLSAGRMRVSFLDPNASTEVRLDAIEQGIVPVPIQAVQGTSALTQEVYLGLVLRYGGRERAIPFALPQSFESIFVTELDRLLRDGQVVVGFVENAGLPTADPALKVGTRTARALVGRDREVRSVRGLAEGTPVPADIDVLIVAGPLELHPRAAFEIDRFARSGGRVLVSVDRVRVSGARVAAIETGMEAVLEAWGAPLVPGHLWDHGSSNSLRTSTGAALQYPYWVRVVSEGLNADLPAVARLPGADLFWCHELALAPEGERAEGSIAVLARSTERTWRVPPVADLAVDAADLEARAAELIATAPGSERVLAAALRGPARVAWEAAPAPRDPVDEAIWAERVRAALEAGESAPAYPSQTTAEPVPSGDLAQVVVVGDADWMSDGETFTERNRMLLLNLVDWLALDDEYRDLRTRRLRERPIADFLAEEREALGVGVLEGSVGLERAEEVSRLESEAQRRAERRRWGRMIAATGGALAALLLVALLARWLLARGVPREASQ